MNHTKTTREDVLRRYLEDTPKARERVNKVRAICNLLQKNHPSIQGIPKDLMTEIIEEALAFDRYWRKLLSENPALRGSDYETKKKVVQRAQINLGYESGFYENSGYRE